jgi:uncharacterized protein with beta-barrel porin domain
MRRDAARLILLLPEKTRRVTRAGAFMTKIFHPAFCAAGEGSGKSGKRALAPFLFSSTAIVALLAASASALAQTPPTPDPNQYGLTLIGAPIAWAAGYTGAGVTIAVGDSGITNDQNPLGFTGAGKIDSRSKNFVLPYPSASYDPNQITGLNAHGTHVSGIALASGTSDTPGVAYDANLVMLRVLTPTKACNVPGANCYAPTGGNPFVASINYFASLANVNIYNASYGPVITGKNLETWPSGSLRPTWANAALNAVSKGKIIVASTGNERANNPDAGKNPKGLALAPFIQPGVNANAGVYDDGGKDYNSSGLLNQKGLIIGVTSVGKSKTIAFDAQMCGVTASWCVAAPGVSIYSTIPASTRFPDGYAYLSGTSMATPMVSGALALLTQAYPAYNSQDLAHVLFATAENLGAKTAADNAAYGYGMAVNGIYGYGLIRVDRAIMGPKTLAAGAAVNVDALQMNYWSQPLTTSGGFSKTGNGYLIVAGRTTAAGDVNVNAGALGVDGTLTLNTKMTVAQGAALAGFGWVNGNAIINGTLEAGQLPNYTDIKTNDGGALPAGIPLTGTSPGTLIFNGKVTLGATADTRVNIDGPLQIPGGPGTYDKIIVAGAGNSFVESGVLTPVLRGIPGGNNNYVPQQGASFLFLAAVNGATLTGSFSGLTQPAAGVLSSNTRLDVVTAPGTVAIDVTPLTFDGLAVAQSTNANQRAVASALDRARPEAGVAMYGSEETIFDALYTETVGGDVTALAALSGQGQAAVPGAVLDAFAGLSGAIADRQELLLSGFGEAPASPTPSIVFSYAGSGPVIAGRSVATEPVATSTAGGSPWTTWGEGYGRASHVGAADRLPGATASSGAFVVGGDRSFSNDFIAGGAVGYTRTALNSADTSATANTYAGALYATWAPSRFVFDARLAAGPTTGGSSRSIAFPGEAVTTAGSLSGWGGLAAADAGYLFEFAGATLKPFVGLTGQTFNRSGFTETTDFGLAFPTQTFYRLTSEVGAWATTLLHADLTTYMVQLKLSWTDDFGNQALTTQAALLDQPFAIQAANPGRNAAVVGINVAAWQTENVALFAKYAGEFRGNANSQQGSVGLRVTW